MDVPDYLWEENYYEAAVRYHRENGDLDVPAKYVDSEEYVLEFGSTVCENQDGQIQVL
ncbi:MAG: helicase associated domain-containing protein [Ruminococcus sp.]